MGEVGRARSPTVGVKDNFEGIQAAVCRCSPSICRSNTLPGSGRVGSCFAGGNPLTVEQRSNLCHTSRSVSERFLLQVFSGPQTGGERYSPYPGSTCSEQLSQEIQVQNANASIPAAPCASERLVHFCRSERRVFPHPDLSSPQKVSEICFPGDLLRVPRAPFRAVLKPEGVCAVHGSGDSPAETAGYPLGHVSGRLAAVGTIGAGGQGAHAYSLTTPMQSGFCDKRGREHAVPGTGHNLSGIIPGLGDFHSTPLSGPSEGFQGMSRALSSAQVCSIQIVSSVTRADGVGHSPSRSPPHEGIPVLGGLMRARSRASWRTEGAGHTGVHQGAAPLASLVLSDPRGAHGSRPVQEGGHYGRLPDWLGRDS